MNLTLRIHPIATARRLRVVSAVEVEAAPHAAVAQRHPAMRGLDVPPVHGQHCICSRCDADTPSAA